MKGSETWIDAERSVRRKQGFRAHALAYVTANSAMIAGWATSGGRFWPLREGTGVGCDRRGRSALAPRRGRWACTSARCSCCTR